MVQKFATITFFIAFGISALWGLAYTGLIAAIAALVAGVAMVIER